MHTVFCNIKLNIKLRIAPNSVLLLRNETVIIYVRQKDHFITTAGTVTPKRYMSHPLWLLNIIKEKYPLSLRERGPNITHL